MRGPAGAIQAERDLIEAESAMAITYRSQDNAYPVRAQSIPELMAERDRLKVENGNLREALRCAVVALKAVHPVMDPNKPCLVYEAWSEAERVLREGESG